MRRRGSIARWMLAIGLLAFALTLLRDWLGPENQFSYLGLLGLMILVSLIPVLMTSGPIRRYFAGSALTGSIIWVAVLIFPSTILGFWVDRLILPVDRWINLPTGPGGSAAGGITRLELMMLWAELGENHFDPEGRRPDAWMHRRTCLYAGMSQLQAVLLIPPAVLSALGGLALAICRPKPTACPSPADRP